jgi:type 2 lantibiotic biosynthesis protein LanM
MIEELTYSYAATSSERIQSWRSLQLGEEECQRALTKWQARKSLLKPLDFKRMLEQSSYDERTFSRALVSFTEERANVLLPLIEKSQWFQLHQEIFREEIQICEFSLKAALRFHLAFYEKQIRKFSQAFSKIQLPEQVIAHLVDQLAEELFFIAQKTLAWDVHQMIEEYQLQSESKETEFTHYIEEFLGDKKRTFLFFAEYPTLARVLATRLTFACEVIEEFLTAINDSTELLSETFAIKAPFQLDHIELGQGDSHDRGKTVIQFQIQETPLIFKFKDLTIGEQFNELLTYIETLSSAPPFYKIKRMLKAGFTIEEKVTYQECFKEHEVSDFYHQYGQLLAITYWLGATDLHMENLIAHGCHPVLIDVETLIRPDILSSTKKDSRQRRIEKNSVLVTGLIPQREQWKRDLDLDALSGTKQKLPQKVRRLQEAHSSNIGFRLEEAYMEAAQNIPRFNGQDVDYHKYSQVIQRAFKEMNALLLENKVAFIAKVKELFQETRIRLIYRDTQDYGNLLNFTLHTDCMSNYIEREKIIENVWASKVVPSQLKSVEVQNLLVHDIPLFTANTSSTSVYADGQEFQQVLNISPLEHTLTHMEKITEKTSHFSYLLLKESLETLEYTAQEITIPERNADIQSSLLRKAADIGDKIIDNLAVNLEEQTIDWLSVLPEQGNKVGVTYPTANLYEGSAGLYLYFVYLHHYVPKDEYQMIITLLEKEVFLSEDSKEEYESAFFAEGMRLTTAFYVNRLLKDKKHRVYLEKSLDVLYQKPLTQTEQVNDWIYGRSSLLAVVAAIFTEYRLPIAKKILVRYIDSIECQEMTNNSFAHGYGGILYGLHQANQVLQSNRSEALFQWYQEQFKENLAIEESLNDSWCRGTSGIKYLCDILHIDFPKKQREVPQAVADDCLCHGTCGRLDYYVDDNFLARNNYFLKADQENCPLGLFCGLSGIGYQLLRAFDPQKVPSIQFFGETI